MTTKILAVTKGILFSFIFLSLSLHPAFGQEKGKEKEKGFEITPEMIQICPDLQKAQGAEQEQLVALYFTLKMEKISEQSQIDEVQKLFALEDPKVSKFLQKHLFRTKSLRCLHGMKVVFTTQGAKGLLWLFKEFSMASTKGQGRIIDVLHVLSFQETFIFLKKLLENKTAIQNQQQEAIAPPGYQAKRICDEAWKMLVFTMDEEKKLWKIPAEWVKQRINPFTPIATRDQFIQGLQNFLKENVDAWEKWVKNKPSMMSSIPLDQRNEAKEVLKKLGIS